MLYQYANGLTSVILRLKIRDATSILDAGLTGLTSASAGLIISTICDNELAATVYTQAGGTIEAVTTIGTYAAPTATKCRFKLVDNTNHPGLYELQFADARFAVTNAKELQITITGPAALNLCQEDYKVQLAPAPADVKLWLASAPNALIAGRVDANVQATAAALTFNLTGNITGNLSGSVGSVTGAVGSVTGAVGSVTGNVGGNVVGSVGSVVGAVGSVTGNVGGNVVGSVGSVIGSVGSVVAAVAILSGIKRNTALPDFEFLMTDAVTHNPVTGKAVTVTRSINNGAFAAGTLSAVTEISNGIYSVDFAAGDLNGIVITLRATAAGCDDLFVTIVPDP